MTDHGLRGLLSESYGIVTRTIERISGRTLRVTGENGNACMVRLGSGATHMAATLLHLEERRCHAPRVVKAVDGAAVTSLGGDPLVVLTYIDGAAPDFTGTALFAAGEALGALHASGPAELIPPAPSWSGVGGKSIPHALMLPATELSGGSSRLRSLEGAVPAESRDYYEAVVAAGETLADNLEECPRVLLHGDCHPWNAVMTPKRDVVYVDWDSSGAGPAVIDLGFLLLSADRGALTHSPVPSDPARVDAVVDGYLRHRLPSELELTRLGDAVRFTALVFALGLMADDLEADRRPTENGWWERCLAADEIGARAAARFRRGSPMPVTS